MKGLGASEAIERAVRVRTDRLCHTSCVGHEKRGAMELRKRALP